MSGLSSKATSIWNTIKGVFSGAMTSIHNGIDSLVTFITKRWDALKNAMAAPIRFVLHPVLSTMAAGINTIGKLVGLPAIGAIPTLATGGQIPGQSPHKRADNIPIMATAGEHMWSVDEVKGAGGHPAMEKMREAARTRGRLPSRTEAGRIVGGAFDPLAAGNPFGYASGGAIAGWPKVSAWISSHLNIPYLYGGTTDKGMDCSSFTQRALGAGGISVPRTAELQQYTQKGVSAGSLIAGDLGFVGRPASHVEIYTGAGNWAEESHPGTTSHISAQPTGYFSGGFAQPANQGGLGTYLGAAGSAIAAIASHVWKDFRAALAGLFNVTVRKPTEALISKIPGIGGMGNWIPKTAAFPLDKAYAWLAGGADKKAAAEAASNAAAVVAGGSGLAHSSGVTRWGSQTAAVAKELGLPAKWGPMWLDRIAIESGGDPAAVNKTDSNWQAGHPSVGLDQVIAGTFAAYAGKYAHTAPMVYGVSEDPHANIYAGMHYGNARYGYDRMVQLNAGHQPYGKGGEIKAYAAGTPYVPQTGMAMLHQGEAIIPAAQNRRGGGGATTIHLTVNVTQPLGTADQIGGVIRDALEKTHRKGARSVVLGF
jgi:hypothetical protein